MERLKSKLTYANVMATIAVFIALGGASYAAIKLPKNSVGAKQLKQGAVTGAKIKNEAVTGGKIKKGTLTGTQINASTLGTVPSASHALGADTATTANSASSLVAPEPVHVVGASGEPLFENGFAAQSTEEHVSFFKDHECIVHLAGEIHGPSGTTAFTLPPGYRPSDEYNQTIQASPIELAGLDIGGETGSEPGEVFPFVKGGGTSIFELDGVTFRAANC
jgi:hypothetical protein